MQCYEEVDIIERYWSIATSELMVKLGASPLGLSTAEAGVRLNKVGANSLVSSKAPSASQLFLTQFRNPLLLILLGAAVVSLFVREWVDASIVLAIIVGSALLSFFQEYSASRAIEELRKRVQMRSRVMRDGIEVSVVAESLVPGDVIMLAAGSLIPADAVLLEACDCFVNQAVLTGESYPAEKTVGPVAVGSGLTERTNCLFMGTSVRSGSATALIVATGSRTSFGEIAGKLTLRQPESSFELGIRKFGYLLTQIMLVLVLVVFAVNVFSAKPPVESLLFAIALAVGLAPELLPAILSVTLSSGAKNMARDGVIVRRLNSIENFGAMDVLCTDKTGTLTEGVVKLDQTLDGEGAASDRVLRLAYLNASLQTGLPNALDEAITAAGQPAMYAGFRKVGEIPYDFNRKRLSVVVVEEEGKSRVLITKGSVASVLGVCQQSLDRGPLMARFEGWSSKGFRVVGLATKELAEGAIPVEEDLKFEGFLLFFDPPKAGVQDSLAGLKKLGVDVKIITGDNAFVSTYLAAQVGLSVDRILTGTQIRALSDEALWHQAEVTNLFVDVDPNQKERIILALKKVGHIVGYMGDGINDAPALYAADVGISVDSAVDVAKESADLVLLEHNLEVLRKGIVEGRKTFANTLKYIFTTTSANFGNMFSMAGASLFLPFLPLLASQILLNNFLSDIPGMAIAGDNVDSDWTDRPHRWNITYIRNFMVVFGLVSSVFDYLTFGVLLYVVKASQEEFRTAWFIESLLTELAVALVVRTRMKFYSSWPGKWLWVSTLMVAILTLLIPYLPYANRLGFVPLPISLMSMVVGITLAYMLSAEAAKHYFHRHFPLA